MSGAEALCAGALAVLTPWPAAGSTLAVLQLLLGPANAACSCRRLLGILDPADELVAGQRCDVLPGIECRAVGDQRLAQVCGQLVDHTTRHWLAAHRATVAGRGGEVSVDAEPALAMRDEAQHVGLPKHYLFGAIPAGTDDRGSRESENGRAQSEVRGRTERAVGRAQCRRGLQPEDRQAANES